MKKIAKNFADFNREWVWGSPLAYLPVFLLLVTCFVPAYQEYERVSDQEKEAFFARVPDMNAAQILREVECLVDEMMQTDASNPVTPPERVFALTDYSIFLDRVFQKNLYNRGRFSNPHIDEIIKIENKLLIGFGTQKPMVYSQRSRLQKELIDRFQGKSEDFDVSLAAWREKHPLDERPCLPSETWRLVKDGYLFSILIMGCFFVMRLHRKEQIVWVEMPRIVLFSILWPVGLFVYPTDKTKMEQIKQALQMLCYSQSAIVSLFGFWGLGAMQMVKAQVSGQTKSKVKEKERRFGIGKPILGAEVYHGNGEVLSENGVLVAPWYMIKSHLGPVNVSQFGFVELGENKSQLFTNHAATFTHGKASSFGYRTEVGGSPGGVFWSGGPVIILSRTPGLRKIIGSALQSLSVARLGRIRGSGPEQEIFFSWATKKIPLLVGDISADGFYRIRPGVKPNVGQPRLIFRPKGWKHTISYEMWWIGYKPTHRLGLEFTF